MDGAATPRRPARRLDRPSGWMGGGSRELLVVFPLAVLETVKHQGDAEALGKSAQFGSWSRSGQLDQVADDRTCDAVGPRLFGRESLGFF